MKIDWFTADLHIGHTNIIQYCKRPFASVREMNEAIVDLWNETVRPHHSVAILGDVCLGKVRETLPVLAQMQGRKHLIMGNHDQCHPMHRRAYKMRAMYRAIGEINGDMTLTQWWRPDAPVPNGGAWLNHFPYAHNEFTTDKFADWRIKDTHNWLIHGHVHDRWRQRGREINVGIDAWGGRLVHVDQIVEYLHQEPTDRDSWPWRPR